MIVEMIVVFSYSTLGASLGGNAVELFCLGTFEILLLGEYTLI
jgi:hypothetical protein